MHSGWRWLLWGRPEFRVTSQQQTPRSSTLSATGCEAARCLTQSDYRGVRTQMSTLIETGNLSYLYLACIKDFKLHFTFNNNPNNVLRTLLNIYQQMPITPHNALSCMYIHLSIYS